MNLFGQLLRPSVGVAAMGAALLALSLVVCFRGVLVLGSINASGGTSKPSTQGQFKIGQLVAHRLELSSNHSRLNKGPRLAFSAQHTGLPR
jgi:hypothetical protein